MTPEQISSQYNYSIIARRWAAFWLDVLFMIALGVVLMLPEKLRGFTAATWVLILVAYYPVLEGLTGSSFGKWMCKIKVVDAQGGTPGIGKAIIRTLLRLIEVNPLLFGGLPAAIAVAAFPTRQRLGDKAANTYVLRCEDLPHLDVPRAVPMQMQPDFFAIPNIPGATPAPRSLPLDVLTTYPGNLSTSGLGPSVVWAKPGAVMLTVCTALLIGAAYGSHYYASKMVRPVTISCSDFVKNPRAEGWYRITGCLGM
jgi:uncharacterized RDD family membrane protein YckC